MKKNPSAVELLNELENRLSSGDYKDSVHQNQEGLKFMGSLIAKTLKENM